MKSLGDRIKEYEGVYKQKATRRTPLMIRVDGKAFHTFTKGMKKPFDMGFIRAMYQSAALTAAEMQGFKAAYIQSDEATFLITDYDKLETEAWFGYNIQKIVSVTASLMTGFFNELMEGKILYHQSANFDCRAFTIPKEEVVNAFLWRAQDWHRNSVQMFARSYFSSKELHGKDETNIMEMLEGIGLDWHNLTPEEKYGMFIVRNDDMGSIFAYGVRPTFESIDKAIGPLL